MDAFCTSFDSRLPSLIERMLSVSQPRLGPDHHSDFQLVRTLPFGKHRVKVICHLKHRTNRVRAEAVYGKKFLAYKKKKTPFGYFSKHSVHILFYLFLDHCRVHVGNLSNGELSSNLSRDDSLCSRVREGPLNAMDGDSGVAPPVCQQVHLQEKYNVVVCTLPQSRLFRPFSRSYSYLIGVHELADTDLALVVFKVKFDVLVHFPLLVGEGSHRLPDPRNQDLTAGADQCV